MIIAATGHRPDKLGGYGNFVTDRLIFLAKSYFETEKPDFIISGMALGWDQAVAEAAIILNIPFIAAVPFIGQESKWPEQSKYKYKKLIEKASKVEIVCPGVYASWKMQTRNEWMVDNCDKLVALWDGTSGGTGNCIKYAKSVNKPIDNIWEAYDRN